MEQTTINSYLREREIKEDCQPKQNVTYLIPYSEPTKVQMIALTTMLSLLSVIGSVGNTLVILVFKSKQEKLVSTFYILVLSVVDLTTCLFIIPFTIYMENVRFRLSSDVACKFYQFLITSNIPFSALIMVAIAFDRYFAICHPLSQVGRHASPVSKVSKRLKFVKVMTSDWPMVIDLSGQCRCTGMFRDQHWHNSFPDVWSSNKSDTSNP